MNCNLIGRGPAKEGLFYMNYNRNFHIVVNAFSEICIFSIPVFIYLFFIAIKIYSGDFAAVGVEMSLMSIMYYSDSVLIAKKLKHGPLGMASNVLLIILIIFSSSMFTLELLSNGTHTATLIYKRSFSSYVDMQVANTILIIAGFAANFVRRIVVNYQGDGPGE